MCLAWWKLGRPRCGRSWLLRRAPEPSSMWRRLAPMGLGTCRGICAPSSTAGAGGRWGSYERAPTGWRRRRGDGSSSSGRSGCARTVQRRARNMSRTQPTRSFTALTMLTCVLNTHSCSPLHIPPPYTPSSPSPILSSFPASAVPCIVLITPNSDLCPPSPPLPSSCLFAPSLAWLPVPGSTSCFRSILPAPLLLFPCLTLTLHSHLMHNSLRRFSD
jgi:hypothetical protein